MYIFHGFGQSQGPLTDEQLGILGRCPNSAMPCTDFKTGEDLWQRVSFLDEGQKFTLGRCPDINSPCMHPPGDPNGVDLWQLIKSKQSAPGPSLQPETNNESDPEISSSVTAEPYEAPETSENSIPDMPDTILAPEIITRPDTGNSNTTMLVGIGIVIVLLTGITIYVKMT